MSGRPKREHVAAIDREAERIFDLYTFRRKTVPDIAFTENLHTSTVTRRIDRHRRNLDRDKTVLRMRIETLEDEMAKMRHIMYTIRHDSKLQQREIWELKDRGRG